MRRITIQNAAIAFSLLLAIPTPTSRAQAPAVLAKGTVIVTLGTGGGPRPRVDRSQSANLLLVNGTPYLIDAGENVVRRLVQAGIDFNAIGHIFITHGHSDHTLGLPALMATQWEFQRREPVQIIGPPGTETFVKGALAFLSTNSDIRSAEGNPSPISALFSAHDTQPGLIYKDANVTVTAVENSHFHFPPLSPAFGKYKSYAYRFATPDRVVVYTGDTGPSDAVAELAKGADVLVSEIHAVDELVALYKRTGVWQAKTAEEQAGWLKHQNDEHLSPEAVAALASKAGVKAVILTHFTPSGIPNDDYERLAIAVRKGFAGDVRVAKDLARF